MIYFPHISRGLLTLSILLFLFLCKPSFSLIHFQETFEDSAVKFFTIDVTAARYAVVNNSRAYVINLMERGYARFKTGFPVNPALSFDISLLEWKTNSPEITHSKIFFQVDIYDTTQELTEVFPLIEAIISDTISGKPCLFFRSNTGDCTGGVPIQNRVATKIRIYAQRPMRDTISLKCEVNGKGVGVLRAILRNGNMGVLAFGPKTSIGPFESLKLSLDNILSADTLPDFKVDLNPSLFTASVEDTNSVRLQVSVLPEDSLIYLEASGKPGMTPLILRRPIGARHAINRLFDFPLPPGSYYLKTRSLKKNGFLTPWTSPARVDIAGVRSSMKKFAIRDIMVTEGSGKPPVTDLVPGKWYVLTAVATDIKRGFALLYFHHSEFNDAGPHNRGGWFDRKLNYIFNFSYYGEQPSWFYISSEEVRGRTMRADGKRFLYVDDSDQFFTMDTRSNTIRVRFRLLNEAKPGEWRMNGYLEDGLTSERSFLFEKPFRVLSAQEIAQLKSKSIKNRVIFVALLLMAVFSAFMGRRAFMNSKNRVISPGGDGGESLLVRLRKTSAVIGDSNHKQHHIIRRIQAYILENLEKDISLSDVAAHLDLSPTYTGKIFKEAMEYTIVQFINRVKIDRACELLLENNMNTIDIGMSVGFPSSNHFRRVFKELTGMLPSEYRNQRLK